MNEYFHMACDRHRFRQAKNAFEIPKCQGCEMEQRIRELEAERDSAIRDAKRWEDESHRQHDKFIASENEHLKNEAERDLYKEDRNAAHERIDALMAEVARYRTCLIDLQQSHLIGITANDKINKALRGE